MLILEIYNLYIKYALIIIFYTNAIFLDNIYININKKEFIEIDNEFKINSNEKDITFKYNSTKLNLLLYIIQNIIKNLIINISIKQEDIVNLIEKI